MIYVTGSAGQLGFELKAKLQSNAIFLDRTKLDLSNPSMCREFVRSIPHQSTIINAAAYTSVDLAETERDLCSKINQESPVEMAKECAKKECKFIQISTDYVFDGKSSVPYTEVDATGPLNFYGASKLMAESGVLAANPDSVVIRTSWLYSVAGKNFVKTILKLGKERENLNIVFDQVGTLTSAQDLAAVIVRATNLRGLYHFTNEGVCSWYDVACYLKKKFHFQASITPIRSQQYPTPASRPSFSVLDKSKIKSDLPNLQIAHWTDSLDRILIDLA